MLFKSLQFIRFGSLTKLTAPQRALSVTSHNERWHRNVVENRKLYRFGYEDKVKRSGPLPRLENDSRKLRPMKVFTPLNPFCPSQALQGQNDYIDILGNPDLHPAKIHYHIPGWLRGFRHNHHFQAVIRKNNYLGTSGMEVAFPMKYSQMQKKLVHYWRWQRKHLNQKRWTNYEGVKYGPVPNPFKRKYPF